MSINIIYILVDTKVFVKEKILDPVDFGIIGNFGEYVYIVRWVRIVCDTLIHLNPFLRVSKYIWITAHVGYIAHMRTAYRRPTTVLPSV